MQKNFSFKGLTLNSDNLLVGDGECMELVNLRCRDGVLLPIPSVCNEKELESVYTKFYWHNVAEMFLGIESSDECAVHFYDKNLNIVHGGDGLMLFPLLKGVERIEFMGNIVCCLTASVTYYLIFNSGTYCWLGERPPLPELSFSIDSVVYSLTTDSEYKLTRSLDDENDELYWGNVSKGFFDECLAELHSKGYYVDRALFRYALRLFDGSYICYSPIYYIDDDNSVNDLSRDDGNFYYNAIDNTDGSSVSSSRFNVRVQGFMPSFNFKNIDLAGWENIVVGIDIFSTGSIYGHKVSDTSEKWSFGNGVYYSDERGHERYVKKSCNELRADVAAAALFYKVAEYSITGVLVDRVENVSLSSLALCNSLPDDEGSLLLRSAGNSYIYNGRLHLAAVRELLFKGYNSYDYLPAAADSCFVDYAMIVTKLKTTKGVSVLKKEFHGTFALGVKDGGYYITPYIMYPDSRAFEITLIVKIGSKVYSKLFPLRAHDRLNLACFINSFGDGSTVTLIGGLSNGAEPVLLSAENVKAFFSYLPGEYVIVYREGEGWFYGDVEFTARTASGYFPLISTLSPAEGDIITIIIEEGDAFASVLDIKDIEIDESWEELSAVPAVEEVNPCEVRANVLKVSAVDNPFYFPAKNTYSPSHSDVIAVCSNTVALSQGQFGQHPLYVFCKDGIWAMSTDVSGAMTYSTAHPVSREVCVNAASVCSIDSGVVFVSNKGLMLLQGGNIVCISEQLHSEAPAIENSAVGSLFYKIALLSYNTMSLSRGVLFKEYLRGAVVGFLASEKELWVSNQSFEYSYLFSLENGCWTKLNKSYSFFINRYPHLMTISSVDDRSYISVQDKSEASGYAPVLLITRPQLWGTKLPKRIVQFMLHASVKTASECASYEYAGVGCYLLCSNDGVHFKLLSGVEKTTDFNDVVFPFFPSQSYKYYVIALSGTMSLESRIVGAELAIECVWNNRLR